MTYNIFGSHATEHDVPMVVEADIFVVVDGSAVFYDEDGEIVVAVNYWTYILREAKGETTLS